MVLVYLNCFAVRPFDVSGYHYTRRKEQFSYQNFSVEYLGGYPFCAWDFRLKGILAGETWTAPSRGLCLVKTIRATLWYYTEERDYNTKVICAPYHSSGTSHSIYSILLKGNDVNRNACCIRSSHELQACD